MRVFRTASVGVALAAFVALLVPIAHAQNSAEARKLTIMTFSGPVEVPGTSLPAGTYRFSMAETTSSSHIVQVFNEDGSKIITQFFAIPDDRPEPASQDKTVVMFAERPAGAPQAVKIWYYPGNSIGEEFVYPKNQASEIAKANHVSVAATEADARSADASGAKIGRVDENGNFTSDDKNAAATTAPSGTSTTTAGAAASAATTDASADRSAQNSNQAPASRSAENAAPAPAPTSARTETAPSGRAVGTSGQANPAPAATAGQNDTRTNQNDQANTARSGRLPRTASPLGLFELLSGLSIAAALSVRGLRRRFAEQV